MTLILAAKTKQGVYIGADARHTGGSSYYYNDPCKLIRICNFIVGGTGSVRTSQLIKFNSDRFSDIHSESDVFRFAQDLKKLMEENGQKKEAQEYEDLRHSLLLLIASPTDIYCLWANYCFSTHDRWGVGSGSDYGLGYFDALPTSTKPEKRLSRAIEATSEYVPGVGGPVTVLKVDA